MKWKIKRLEAAVKRVEGGVFSNFANDHLQVGDEVELLPPQGRFFTRLDATNTGNYLFIAAAPSSSLYLVIPFPSTETVFGWAH